MARVAFIGTGMMGSGMIEAMLRRGDSVVAWNRTLDHARPVEKLGARLARSAAEAVREAERIHLCLSDDAAVDGILGEVRSSVPVGALVVDHTTVSPAGTVARFRACQSARIAFLHAPVFMSPQACREAKGVMLCSGPGGVFARAEQTLRAMTGDLWYLGERADLAAAYKLLGNALILAIVGGLADVYQLAASLGIRAVDAHALFSRFNPAGIVAGRGKDMAEGSFEPAFELVMARKDLRLMLEAVEGPPLAVLPALAARFDQAIAEGHGREDVGAIAAGRRR
jgi:3-hydroxyisobutyrate dehydrogenase-like beta-hydroxyacid dehydrogenase